MRKYLQRKYLIKKISDKRLVSKIYEEFLTLNNMKTDDLVKKQGKVLNRYFTKENIQGQISR